MLVKTDKLKKFFQLGRNQTLHAVDGVSLEIAENETLGLVERDNQITGEELRQIRDDLLSTADQLLRLNNESGDDRTGRAHV